MTSTSQGNVPADHDSSSVEQSVGADKTPKLVPLEELIAQRQKTREAQEQIAQLQAKVAKQREADGKASPEPLEGIDDLRRTVEEIKTRDRIRDLKIELGLGDEKQAEEVAKFLEDNKGLNPTEALQLLAKRDPAKFASSEGSDAARAQFGTLRPRPGSQPEPREESDWQRRLEYTQKMASQDKREHRKLADNMVGSLLAKAMGWEHQKIQLPQK